MSRQHQLETDGQPTVKLQRTETVFDHYDDEQTATHIAGMGLTEDLLTEARAAAQRVFDAAKVQVFVAHFGVEQVPAKLSDCGCGSRCTSWGCQPYQSCSPDGSCVSGHRTVCTGMSCNPC